MNPKAEAVRIKMLGNQHPKLFPHDDLLEKKYPQNMWRNPSLDWFILLSLDSEK